MVKIINIPKLGRRAARYAFPRRAWERGLWYFIFYEWPKCTGRNILEY